MSTLPKPPGKAVYTAIQSDNDWLWNVQKKLYERSWNQPSYVFRELWGLITDPRNLRTALARISRNKGSRTGGVDRLTVRRVLQEIGAEKFLDGIRQELRSGTFEPSPARRVLIPKQGHPGKFRPLGIPTVKDRIIQAAIKNILEPIFEADFYPMSYGFRPGKSAHGALTNLKTCIQPMKVKTGNVERRRSAYQYAIEGDIKGCFDNIGHHGLMERVRRRCGDGKLNRLIVAFLKSGIMSEGQFSKTEQGTPQGGILSPLLANVALSAIEERYRDFIWPRNSTTPVLTAKQLKSKAYRYRFKRKIKETYFSLIRYADDFVLLIGVPEGPDQDDRARIAAEQEKEKLAEYLKSELGLDLSETKTLVTPVTKPIRFLGYHVRVRKHPSRKYPTSHMLIPKDRSQLLREKIKELFAQGTTHFTLRKQLIRLNYLLRGWGNYYRHAWGAKAIFSRLGNYCWKTIERWLKRKHGRRATIGRLIRRYGYRPPGWKGSYWRDGNVRMFQISSLKVEMYRMAWEKIPFFAKDICGEPCA